METDLTGAEVNLFKKVLVANRGEIAVRIMRTLRELGIKSVAVYSEPDAQAPHVRAANEAVLTGPAPARESYLDIQKIIDAARQTGADAIHPGYGFLSENATFAQACTDAGIVFIGPTSEAMKKLGDKRAARETAKQIGVPTVPGANECDTPDQIRQAANEIGLPVLLKASAGGGGKGMRLVQKESELEEAIQASQREALAAFGDGRLMIEKFVKPARHIEVQLLGDTHGHVIALGERECSLQRRYQKIIEESPSIAVNSELREKIQEAACKLARATGYYGAGTAEFLLGPDGNYYFLEVNTRLQVEHPVTESVTGLDLVREQIEIAVGKCLSLQQPDIVLRGHAIEARLYAEDPHNKFLPTAGKILKLHWPALPGVRIDSGIRQGQDILSFYDPLLAKVIAWGPDREQARQRLIQALRETLLLGIVTNQDFLIQLLESESFKSGQTFTHSVESNNWSLINKKVQNAMLFSAALSLGSGAKKERLLTSPASATINSASKDLYSPWDQLGYWRISS